MIYNSHYYPDEVKKHLRWYDPDTDEVKGDAMVAVICGNRKGGKTVGTGLRILVENYLDRGERCVLLARTDKQMGGGYLEKWWNKVLVDDDFGISKRLKEHEIKFSKDVMTVDGDVMCYCVPVSMSRTVKDEYFFDKATTIVLDEAFQDGERSLMIMGRSMMSRIWEIYWTVARGWKHASECTNMIFIANSSQRENWLFVDLGLNNFVRKDTKFTCQKGIVFEMVNNDAINKEFERSLLSEVMKNSKSGSEYMESAVYNAFNDNTAFVKPMPLDFKKLKIQLAIRGHFLGVFDAPGGGAHIAKIERDERSRIICNSQSDHIDGVTYEFWGEAERSLADMYKANKVTFSNQETKGLFLEYCHVK